VFVPSVLISLPVTSNRYDGGQVHQLNELHVSSVTPGAVVDGLALLPLVVRQRAWREPEIEDI
jgi:hypothetical protein